MILYICQDLNLCASPGGLVYGSVILTKRRFSSKRGILPNRCRENGKADVIIIAAISSG